MRHFPNQFKIILGKAFQSQCDGLRVIKYFICFFGQDKPMDTSQKRKKARDEQTGHLFLIDDFGNYNDANIITVHKGS